MTTATSADQQRLKEMIHGFYAIANVPPPQLMQINDNVANIFLKMLQAAEQCTNAIVLVPHPQ